MRPSTSSRSSRTANTSRLSYSYLTRLAPVMNRGDVRPASAPGDEGWEMVGARGVGHRSHSSCAALLRQG